MSGREMKMTNKRRVGLAVLVTGVFASGCSNPLSAEATSNSSTDKFCELVEERGEIPSEAFDDDVINEVNEYLRDVRDVLPSDAPPEAEEFLNTSIESTDNGFEGFIEASDGISEATVQVFEDYIETTCNSDLDGTESDADSSAASGGSEPDSTTLPALESKTILSDGPSGNYEEITVDIGEVHTTNDPVGFLAGDTAEPSDQAHLLVEIDVESQVEEPNQFQAADFKLKLADGTVIAATSLLDSSGKSASLNLQGRDSASTFAVFETDSAVTSLSAISVGIDREEHVPLYLPLEGAPTVSYPVGLEVGQSTQMAGRHPTDFCETLFDANVKSAEVALETFADVTPVGRTNRQTRFVVVTLEMKNMTDLTKEPSSRRQSCSLGSGQLVNANIRLLADDKPLSNQTASYRWPNIAIGSAEDIELVYEIPLETAAITLIGHEDEDVIASWDLALPQVPGEA